jgi:steroid delta-isomerase-like uncharacterized protein
VPPPKALAVLEQVDESRVQARMYRVREHVAGENRHDLAAIMATVSPTAEYDEVPWGERSSGRDAVQAYYTQLLESVPDLQIDVQRWHHAGETIVIEVVIRGTHLGAWRGLPPTGRPVEIPLCGIFTFDGDDRIAGEKIYYDRATVLRQLGVFHEPQTLLGRILTAATHPVTMARAVARKVRSS